MKIGIVSPAALEPLAPYVENGGTLPKGYVFQQTTMLIQELLRRGHEVSLFTLDSSVGDNLLFKGENLNIHVGGYRSIGYVRAATQFRRERAALVRAMREDPCDVLHAHWTYEFALAALTINPAALVTVHDWAPVILQMQRRFQDRFYRYGRLLMNNKTLARGQHFTAPSPYIAEMVKNAMGKPCAVIPNALPDVCFNTSPRRRNEQSFKIISINNGFNRLKNVTMLIEAFQLVRRQLPAAELVLVGHGYAADGVAATWAKEHNLAMGLKLLGPQPYEQVHDLLSEADLLVHPSLEESFGMTLIEAMAKGVPVIGGRDSGAVPWVLAGGEAGILVDVTSPAAIAKASIDLLLDSSRWEHISEAGFEHAVENFKLSKTTVSLEDLYVGILNNRRDGT